jgi:hypothetical protein
MKWYRTVRIVEEYFFMEYVTMCLDSTNKLEHWYVRHNNVHSFHGLTCPGGPEDDLCIG